jgi:hypothetical protein
MYLSQVDGAIGQSNAADSLAPAAASMDPLQAGDLADSRPGGDQLMYFEILGKISNIETFMTKPKANELVVCVDNDGFSASLEK